MAGGRKRKAITPNSKDTVPPPATKRGLRSTSAVSAARVVAVVPTSPAAAAAVAPDEQPAIEFVHLPFHFLVQISDYLNFQQMSSYRMACTATKQAVDHWGRSQREMPIKKLLIQLWPDRFDKHDFHFDSLYDAKEEMRKLSTWFAFDLLTSIDFDGVSNLCGPHLKLAFGDTPLARVTKVNAVGCVVMPEAWMEMSHLFPNLTTVKITEERVQFPADMTLEVTRNAKSLAPDLLVNQKKLADTGMLDKERIVTLRCLKKLFKRARYMRIE